MPLLAAISGTTVSLIAAFAALVVGLLNVYTQNRGIREQRTQVKDQLKGQREQLELQLKQQRDQLELQMKQQREEHEGQLAIVHEGQITERFTRAVEQLGNDKADVRVGGIYALEKANLELADLRGAQLGGAFLSGASLDAADLQGAELKSPAVWPDGFDPAARGVRTSG